jgi:hypothetical protein
LNSVSRGDFEKQRGKLLRLLFQRPRIRPLGWGGGGIKKGWEGNQLISYTCQCATLRQIDGQNTDPYIMFPKGQGCGPETFAKTRLKPEFQSLNLARYALSRRNKFQRLKLRLLDSVVVVVLICRTAGWTLDFLFSNISFLNKDGGGSVQEWFGKEYLLLLSRIKTSFMGV